jgi:hypothetical protein
MMEQNRFGLVPVLATAISGNNLRAAELSAHNQEFPDSFLQNVLQAQRLPGLQLARLLVN